MIVIGSGYGGSIAASRCARAGQAVCVLERGKEWLPGEFPETFSEASKETQVSFGGKKVSLGKMQLPIIFVKIFGLLFNINSISTSLSFMHHKMSETQTGEGEGGYAFSLLKFTG